MNFDGSGAFKFALVNADGTTSYWSNDDTSNAGSEPTAAVTLTVAKGLYSVLLGDTTLGANMTPIPNTVFANENVWLRVWFDDGTASGSQLLTPDQRIAAVGYAMVAAEAQTVPDGAITSTKIAAGSVGSTQLDSDLTFSGTTSGTFSGDGSGLTNLPAAATTAPIQAATPQANMVWIKEGSFAIGSPSFESGRVVNEGPQTSVTISRGFWMGIYEVTQAQYQAVMGSNPSVFTGDLTRPVDSVNRNHAEAYCAALTTTERAAGRCPADWSYRLPTEAEWEYACRAGMTTRFSHGDDPSESLLTNYAWYSSNSGASTHPVGQKAPNPWGLYDMHGNVLEWCLDRIEDYPGGSTIDPLATTAPTNRVLRGGSWNSSAGNARCASRYSASPSYADTAIGFRAVLAPAQ